MKTTAAQRRAIAAGCARSVRSRATRARYAAVIGALVRIGRGDLLAPSIREAEITRVLHGLAAKTDPKTDDGAAIRGTLARLPRSFTMFCRRNRKWLRDRLTAGNT